jgi:hypothetical protein
VYANHIPFPHMTHQAIEESVYVHEKFPLIIDPTGKAKMFLKYQTGSFITQPEFANKELINRCLAGCIVHVSYRADEYICYNRCGVRSDNSKAFNFETVN